MTQTYIDVSAGALISLSLSLRRQHSGHASNTRTTLTIWYPQHLEPPTVVNSELINTQSYMNKPTMTLRNALRNAKEDQGSVESQNSSKLTFQVFWHLNREQHRVFPKIQSSLCSHSFLQLFNTQSILALTS
jgi:hypothetical protein